MTPALAILAAVRPYIALGTVTLDQRMWWHAAIYVIAMLAARNFEQIGDWHNVPLQLQRAGAAASYFWDARAKWVTR